MTLPYLLINFHITGEGVSSKEYVHLQENTYIKWYMCLKSGGGNKMRI